MVNAALDHKFILALRISLMDSEPEIWRRFLVPYDITLMRFHEIIQAVMGWENSHLFEFHTAQGTYAHGILDLANDAETVHPVRSAILKDIISSETDRFEYVYDIGDNWEHEIVLEEMLTNDTGEPHLQCVGGANQCPPEDIGGIGGYEEFLAAIDDPHHPEYEYFVDVFGDEFDATRFDMDVINRGLQRIKRKIVRSQLSTAEQN